MSDLDDIRSRLDRLTWELLEHIAESFMLGHTVCPEDDEFILVRKYLQLVEDIQGRRQRGPVFGRFSASDLKDSKSYMVALMRKTKQDKDSLPAELKPLHSLNLKVGDIVAFDKPKQRCVYVGQKERGEYWLANIDPDRIGTIFVTQDYDVARKCDQ